MPTKISRIADGVLEAAWMAALVLVPVFFNLYSSRLFEPDKVALLRSLALVILAAWVVKAFESGGFSFSGERRLQWRQLLRQPLAVPLLLLGLALLLATLFSVAPAASLWGSYQRLQGAYTTLAYLVVLASLAANLRRPEQMTRLVSVAILASLPVSLYGILQHLGADPIPWAIDVSGRVTATLGNSIFVAAYLIMVVPLTLLRAVEAIEAALANPARFWLHLTRALIYGLILMLQILTIYFSGSRGPWLGLGAGLVVMGLGVALIWRKRWMAYTGVGLALAAGIFLVLLNLPNGPLQSLRQQPGFSRLGELLNAQSRTGRVRTLVWQGALDMVLPHAPLEFPDGHTDSFNIIRPLVGYGPESMYVAYPRFLQPELYQVEDRNASSDRSHNETWDVLITSGGLGLVAYLALFGQLLYYGLKWLGWVPDSKARHRYLACYLGGGIFSTAILVAAFGWHYFGVALPFGMIFGVILYLAGTALSPRSQPESAPPARPQAYLLLALLAALTAHFLEINFGIAISSTRTYFWVYAAMLLVAGFILPRQQTSQPAVEAQPQAAAGVRSQAAGRSSAAGRRKATARPAPRRISFWLHNGVIAGLTVALLLTALGYAFISHDSAAPGAAGLLWASFSEGSGALVLFTVTWLAGVLLLASESARFAPEAERIGGGAWLKTAALAAGLSLGVALCFWLWHAASLAALVRVSPRSITEVLSQVRRTEGLFSIFLIQVLLLLAALALANGLNGGVRTPRPKVLQVGFAVFLTLLAVTAAVFSNVRVVQADMAFKTADAFTRPESWPAAIAIYQRAIRLAPGEDYYSLYLGFAYQEYAKTLSEPAARQPVFEKTGDDLRRAQQLNPLNPDHTVNLARLYVLWASYSEDSTERRQLALTADEYYATALRLSPKNVRFWNERALLTLNTLENPEDAYAMLQQSLQIDPSYDWTYALLADYDENTLAQRYPDQSQQKRDALESAARNYQLALEKGRGKASPATRFNYAVSLGSVQLKLGQLDPAINAYQQALDIYPQAEENWRVLLIIARLYATKPDAALAEEVARKALLLAPEDQKQAIEELLAGLGK